MKYILLTAIILITYQLAMLALDRQERHECQVWAEQAITYQGFYYEKWQKAQCGIETLTTYRNDAQQYDLYN